MPASAEALASREIWNSLFPDFFLWEMEVKSQKKKPQQVIDFYFPKDANASSPTCTEVFGLLK